MTPDLLTLARSVVALPGWRWMPGMLDTEGRRVLAVGRDGLPCLWLTRHQYAVIGRDYTPRGRREAWAQAVPDLITDAATGGCLLAMLGGQVGVAVADGSTMVAVDLQAGEGATLAEACARVALARGRWP